MQLNMLEAMNIYVNVVEQGSFIRAAEVLELHRPAVTRAVQNLEHDLGVKLLHRTTRQVSMTDEGVIRLGELNDSSFVARRLGTAAMVTCAAPSYLAKHGTPHSIDELMKSHRAVNFFSNHSLQIMEWKFTVDGSIASIKVPSSILVDNSEAFLSCGLAGLGILHGLRPSLAPFIASGELTENLTDFPPPPKPVSLLYPDRRYLAPKVRVFIDWLCEVFGPDAHL
ncbi:LysR family transcriptional regulator [Salmonella enterica subsp. enterica serovar Give]|nr:LysR family transcriptional regulator [Salmonella enterica subsp. enterica serovar Give]